VEAARALAAEILLKGPPNDERRIRWAWRLVLSREATSDEVAVLNRLLQKHRAEFATDTSPAAALISVGLSESPNGIEPAELAAWTSVCRVLLNLSETITRT
jgi:hypothetical protein